MDDAKRPYPVTGSASSANTGEKQILPQVVVRRRPAPVQPIQEVCIQLSEKDARELLALLGQSNTCYSLYSLLLDRMDYLV